MPFAPLVKQKKALITFKLRLKNCFCLLTSRSVRTQCCLSFLNPIVINPYLVYVVCLYNFLYRKNGDVFIMKKIHSKLKKHSTCFTDNEYILRTNCYMYTILSNFYCPVARNQVT